MGDAILGCRLMKLGLGVNCVLYADDAKVLASLVEMRRIEDTKEMALKVYWDLHHTGRNIHGTDRTQAESK